MGQSNIDIAKSSLEAAKRKLADAKEVMKRDVERETDPKRRKQIRASRMATVERYKSDVERWKRNLAKEKELEKSRKKK